MARRVLAERGQVDATVFVVEEHRLVVVTPLRDVMRNAGHNDSGDSSHALSVRRARDFAQRKIVKG